MKLPPLRVIIRALLSASAMLTLPFPAQGQKPVYQCNGTYTDKPCAGGREVDILPTEGAHSMSGTRKQSQEAAIRDITRNMDKARDKGMQQGLTLTRCNQLRQERIRMDSGQLSGDLEGRRLAVRQELFKLGCSRT